MIWSSRHYHGDDTSNLSSKVARSLFQTEFYFLPEDHINQSIQNTFNNQHLLLAMAAPKETDLGIPEDLNAFMERPAHYVVNVMRPSGAAEITVDIEYRLPDHKPFLGGYKNRVTGSEFHHVARQTPLLPHQRGLDKLIDKFHRACQTQMTTNDDGQMAREFG
jgi:hypothetical protein